MPIVLYVQTVNFVSHRVDSTPNFMSNESTWIWDTHKSCHRSETLLKAPHAWRLNVRLKITAQFSVLLFYLPIIYLAIYLYIYISNLSNIANLISPSIGPSIHPCINLTINVPVYLISLSALCPSIYPTVYRMQWTVIKEVTFFENVEEYLFLRMKI